MFTKLQKYYYLPFIKHLPCAERFVRIVSADPSQQPSEVGTIIVFIFTVRPRAFREPARDHTGDQSQSPVSQPPEPKPLVTVAAPRPLLLGAPTGSE